MQLESTPPRLEPCRPTVNAAITGAILLDVHATHCNRTLRPSDSRPIKFHVVYAFITQRRGLAKSVGWVFSAASVCLFVCQHDNFWTSKHRTMKLGGRCIVHKSRPSSNLGS